ncbi:hypothetical protein KC19_12G148900 [Ceratodon purpureus]|uniref:Uncharacterized protein n=1 Tax=Ceratodon purpureus TaxID=3225 RepID=A0A8T0G9W6_CERPU|nr:hypothetical protein KC19_12G148900 [Ceratodon purpureus]
MLRKVCVVLAFWVYEVLQVCVGSVLCAQQEDMTAAGASLSCILFCLWLQNLTAPRNLARLVTLTLLSLKVAAIDSTPHLLVLWGINLLFQSTGWYSIG